MQLMSLPRCGVKDKVGFGSDSRSKRYALQGSRWKVKNLTYRISKYPKKLNRPEVDKEIARAFAVWSEYTDLTFTAKRTNPVHIEIRFEENEHGDGDPFDGPGGTLAHAYFPVYGGDAHFDDAEYWTIGSSRGTNLFQVAAHEFGHSLGLSHSDVRSALMAPFYRGFDPVFRLDSDDIQVSCWTTFFTRFILFRHCKWIARYKWHTLIWTGYPSIVWPQNDNWLWQRQRQSTTTSFSTTITTNGRQWTMLRSKSWCHVQHSRWQHVCIQRLKLLQINRECCCRRLCKFMRRDTLRRWIGFAM